MASRKQARSPEELLRDEALSRADKIERLRRWEYDLREKLVAAEEGMTGDGSAGALLARVRRALGALDAAEGGHSPTKQGG